MQRLKDAGLNPMLVYGSGSHSFTAGSMSASGASGAGSGLASSIISGALGRLTQRKKTSLLVIRWLWINSVLSMLVIVLIKICS